MQVAIISQVQNRITKSLEAGVVQHLLDRWERNESGFRYKHSVFSKHWLLIKKIKFLCIILDYITYKI